jgi:O-antigen ligase
MLVALDWPAPWGGRTGMARRRQACWRGGFVVVALAFVLIVAETARLLARRTGVGLATAWLGMKHAHAADLLVAGLWLASSWAWAAWRRRRRRRRPPAPAAQWLERSAFCLTALLAWSFVTAMASSRPDHSFRDLTTEIGLYAPLTLFWLRHARLAPALQSKLKRCGLCLLTAGTLAGTAAVATYLMAGPALKRRMETFEWRYSEIIVPTLDHGRTIAWRLTFPFGHHNRMAYFSMLAMLMLGGAALKGPKGRRAAWGIGATLATVNMFATLNRGVLVALTPGVAFAAWARLGRRAWPLALLAPVALMLLPTAQRQRVLTIFQARTYAQRDSTVVYRFRHYAVAMRMIVENPVLGIGYGWKHFERTYREIGDDEAVHAHNIWLEQGAETGLPGLALLLAWRFWNWALMASLWRRREELASGDRALALFWIVAEMTIQLYCLTNYPLRRSLGIMTWVLWAIMSVDLARLLSAAPPKAPAAPAITPRAAA